MLATSSRTGRLTCRMPMNGRWCRAYPMPDGVYCYAHERYGTAALKVTLADLWRLADEFDERSRDAGELYSATEFVIWLKPELAGLEG